MKIYKDLVQGTPEWFAVRKGKMTASNAQAIANQGKGLDTYAHKVMAEYFSSAEQAGYLNDDMIRGTELEAQARSMYELETGNTVEQIGFCEYTEYSGSSPDGFVGLDGGLEIKCPNDVNHLRMILYGEAEIDTGYIWQVQMNMLCAHRSWWDLVFYNPNFEKSLIMHRITADQVQMEKLTSGLAMGEGKIKAILNQLTQIA